MRRDEEQLIVAHNLQPSLGHVTPVAQVPKHPSTQVLGPSSAPQCSSLTLGRCFNSLEMVTFILSVELLDSVVVRSSRSVFTTKLVSILIDGSFSIRLLVSFEGELELSLVVVEIVRVFVGFCLQKCLVIIEHRSNA